MTRLRWSIVALTIVLLFQVFWRSHTFGDSALYRPLISRGWAAGGSVEPLDCDEAIYAYMGRRMIQGDVLYRDLSENKPPLGYWLYAATVAIGGANEWTIRLMPLPFVLATTILVWWITRRLAGETAAVVAAFLFALVDTDPYLFGNGANLEHAMNLFAVCSLGCFLKGFERNDKWWLLGSGLAIGAESLIKQVAVLPTLLYVFILLFKRPTLQRTPDQTLQQDVNLSRRLVQVLFLGLGFGTIWLTALGVLFFQGVLSEGIDHFVTWAAALARETPPDAHAPSHWIRWFTGNSDPRNGHLPWPFGKTEWLVWWGAGAWPLWAGALPSLVYLGSSKGAASRKIVAVWTFCTFLEILPSGLYWQHYYLLAVPGLAICFAVMLSEGLFGIVEVLKRDDRFIAKAGKALLRLVVVSTLFVAIAWTIRIQVRDYLLVTPERITTQLKGGGQWVALKRLGIELKERLRACNAPPTLFVWGWQSPLYIYGELNSPTKYAFSDPLLKAFASSDHPLVRPRVEQILADLKAKPPTLILVADPPFPALKQFLIENYQVDWSGLVPRSPNGQGLWIIKSVADRFERAGAGARQGS